MTALVFGGVSISNRLAYGSSGRGEIGPNEVLVFDVELLAVQ